MFGILEFGYQLFNSSDFSVGFARFLRHLIDCQLNTLHDLILNLDFIMFANNLFDLMNSIVFDTVKFLLDFFIVVELFVEFYNFIFGLIDNDDNVFNLF